MKTKVALLFFLLVMLAGCALPTQERASEIRPMELSEREKNILLLVGAEDLDILLFEYDVGEPCTKFEAWVEVYEKGELTASWPAGITMGGTEPKPWKGTLAVTVDKSDGFRWAFVVEEESGGRVSQRISEPLPAPENAASAWGSIAEPVAVVPGEEIILYSAVYSTGDTMLAYNEEEYRDPEQIKKQEYLQLIKCRFSLEE